MDSKELEAMRASLEDAIGASGYAETSNWAIKHGRSLLAHIAAQDARIDADADLIATLRADLAKAVEGLERIEGQAVCVALRHNAAEADDWLNDIAKTAQSLIKELRP